MAITEHTINDAIAALLRQTRRAWRQSTVISSENTGMIKGKNTRPDILAIEPLVSPVVVETEVLPAVTVETEAISRLGETLRNSGKTILSAVAVRLPLRLRTVQQSLLNSELANATDIEMALFVGSSPEKYTRWPNSGWLNGKVSDLSFLIQSASIPPEVIDQATDYLVNGVIEAAGLLEDIAHSNPGAINKISLQLRQEDGIQTRRMAATILANAFMFHESLAGGPNDLGNVASLEELRGSSGGLSKSNILAEWRKILTVNYWPIFDISRRILEVIPTAESRPLIEGLTTTADKLLQNRLMRSHDLTGAVFQRLIADRKFLAAFYTTPASAALLVGLAISPERAPNEGSWSNPDDVKALRIADFACGTGTLLSAAYHRVSQLHELAGGDSEVIHSEMMATAIVGCDVLPAAAHLTASMLAGSHPTVSYDRSSILTVAYGRQEDGGIALGSLDLLDPQGKLDLISIATRALEGTGESVADTWRDLPHSSFDLVLMNPPFTRATNHEGQHANIPNPMFAAFGSSHEEQELMSNAAERLTRGTSAHGNAGEASIFLVLADRKLKSGGTLALVMPLTLLSGIAWEESRRLLRRDYSDLILVSIAGDEGAEMSFSADTGMGECIVIARKTSTESKRATFVILKVPPTYPLVGATTAEQIRSLIGLKTIKRLEDGPIGGSHLRFGNEIIGQAIDAPLPESGSWNLIRISDLSLAQVAYQLISHKRVWLPTMQESSSIEIPLTTIEKIGKTGPYHLDISKKNHNGSVRGPFELIPLTSGKSAPTYPILWKHDAKRERTMVFGADHEGVPYTSSKPAEQQIITQKVERVWGTASHCHSTLDFQFNSQSTAMQFTTHKTIGGRAWISVQLPTQEHEKALVAWSNTTFGLLLFWWHSSKQQSGRGIITKQTLGTLPVLDVTALSQGQLNEAVKVFDEMCQKPLRPFHEIDIDPVRQELDEKFAKRVLGVDDKVLAASGPLELLRMKLSREPSIRGSK